MNIVGYYKKWILVEQNGKYMVVDRPMKKVLITGSESVCTKVFVMLAASHIDESLKRFLKTES